MENKIFRKSISFDRVFYGFDLEIGLHFYFYYKPFPGPRRAKRGRGREKEERVTDPPKTDCTPAPVPPYISHHHRDRITTEDRSTQTDPPKIASPQTDRTPLRSHHHRRPIHPKPISSASSLPISFSFSTQSSSASPISSSRSHRINDLVVSILSPMTHDQSLPFPQFLITLSSSLSQFDQIVEF